MTTGTLAQPTTFDPARYKETTREQWQSAAEAWHRWTPAIQDWLGPATERMLDLAGVGPGSAVLDLAAGAGEPAITIARRVGPAGSVLATDISANILTYAEQAARRQGVSNLTTRVMDGEDLDALPADTFDVVTSRVGLIYFPDQQRALAGSRRVLRPGGRIAAMVYAPADRNQFFSIPISIIRRRAQLPPPVPGQPGPFSLGDDGVLEAAYRRAGFREIVTERIVAPVRMASAMECVRFERESFGALHQMMSGLSPVEREETWREIERELSRFEGTDGFTGPCEMVIGVGVK
jgi:ubiquinone/menaquinone biosynthesis C-methylase UbiE